MRILLDTNVLIDYLTEREPFYEAAFQIILGCKTQKYEGVVAAHSLVDIFYILRKHYTISERRKMLLAFCDILQVEEINRDKIKSALKNELFSDFEDCLQSECASKSQADYIVTRNIKDFEESKVPVLTPDEFINKTKI